LHLPWNRCNYGSVMTSADPAAEPPLKRKRIEVVDLARGIALIAMAVYHFNWDLEFFGYLETGTTAQGWLKLLARCTASSFLFLVGVSLYLAHGQGVRWQSFLTRFATVAGAALLITASFWLTMPPGALVFFGILHEIALASLLGLAFLRLPALVTLAVAALVIAAPWFARSSFFDPPWWWWTGLSQLYPRSNDYVPVFPWFGVVLCGIGFTRLATSAGLTDRLATTELAGTGLLRFAGRHSLAFYLIHQPVLIACVWLFSQVLPPAGETPEVRFRSACEAECINIRDEEFCARYCVCMLDELEKRQATDKVFADQSQEFRGELESLASQCTATTERLTGGEE